MSRVSSLSLSLSLITVVSLLAAGCSKNWKDDGDGPVTAGKDSDAGHDDRTCNGASACVPTCALVDSTPRFTLLPSSRRHVHPHENPTSSGHGGVVEANGTLISKNIYEGFAAP